MPDDSFMEGDKTAIVSGRWNWFLSGNFQGKWIVTSGYAEVVNNINTTEGILYFLPDTNPYARMMITVEGDVAKAIVSWTSEGVPEAFVEGGIYSGSLETGEYVTSVVMTDGFTIIGLAKGNKSNEKNLA